MSRTLFTGSIRRSGSWFGVLTGSDFMTAWQRHVAQEVVRGRRVLSGIDLSAIVLALHRPCSRRTGMPRPWAYTQRRKMLRLRATSRRRRWVGILTGLILFLAFVVWLRLSDKAHAWLAKLVSARSWILASPSTVTRDPGCSRNSCSPRVVAAAQLAGSAIAGTNFRESV